MIRTTGRFVDARYRGKRMRPPEWVGADERASMFVQRAIRVRDARTLSGGACVGDAWVRSRSPPHRGKRLLRRGAGSRPVRGMSGALSAAHRSATLPGCSPTSTETAARHVDGRGRTLRAPMVRQEPLFHLDVTPYAEFPSRCGGGRTPLRIYTLWRNCSFRHPVRTMPLALCDVRSVLPEDVVFAESLRRRDPPKRGYSYHLVHRRTQQWHYFPAMSADEVLCTSNTTR